MSQIILYSTGCPKCNVLKRKMEKKNIAYKEISDLDIIKSKGITAVPYLQIDNQKLMDFSTANTWINQQ